MCLAGTEEVGRTTTSPADRGSRMYGLLKRLISIVRQQHDSLKNRGSTHVYFQAGGTCDQSLLPVILGLPKAGLVPNETWLKPCCIGELVFFWGV